MTDKLTYFVKITDSETGLHGVGEVALFQGLSAEDSPGFEQILADVCRNINSITVSAIKESSIKFGLETAFADLANGGIIQPFYVPNQSWAHEINGLVWMADKQTMLAQARQKIEQGFRCVKLKIGGIDFEKELEILDAIRGFFSKDCLEIRLDANGAFAPDEAMRKLEQLSRYDIHSIEQPIKAGQWEEMAIICRNSPINIALDEELIGLHDDTFKKELLQKIRPNYIILKPSLCGGFAEADRWIDFALSEGIGWWATSALESDVGLNAIARWLAEKGRLTMAQGLGTGQLYVNNFPSQLKLESVKITSDYSKKWNLLEVI